MKGIVHYPTTDEGKNLLAEKVSVFYAKIISEIITVLPCSRKNKMELMNFIIQESKSKDSNLSKNKLNE